MSGHSTYQPTNPAMQWLEKRLPIGGLIHSSFIAYPTPRNLELPPYSFVSDTKIRIG